MKKHLHDHSKLWDYEILQELGKGQYGYVYKVRNKKDQQIYALKKVNISSAQEKQKIQAFRQIKALKLIQHPNVINYFESFLSVENIYIVMEYASKGDLSKIIRNRKHKEKPFSEQEIWEITTSLISALKYLHEIKIVHRDIKLENIFMTQTGKIKIGDLGLSKLIQNDRDLISTRVGTPIYFAPEIIQHQLYSFPVDVWSLGCCLSYLAAMEHPFKDATIETLAYYVIDRDPKPVKGQYSAYLINFITSLLTKNPQARPTIFEAALRIKETNTQTNRISIFNFKHLDFIKNNELIEPSSPKKVASTEKHALNISVLNCERQLNEESALKEPNTARSMKNYLKRLNVMQRPLSPSRFEINPEAWKSNNSPQGSPTSKWSDGLFERKFNRKKYEYNQSSMMLPIKIVEPQKDKQTSQMIKTSGFSVEVRSKEVKAQMTDRVPKRYFKQKSDV